MKKRAKKLAAAFLVATLAAGMVPQTSVVVKADSEEPYEVVMTYATIGYEPQDLSMVEKALSDLALEKINCTVKFKTVNASDFTSQYNLWASSGEKVDLLVFWGLGLDTYVNEGQIIPLDDYLEYAPAVQELEEETGFLAGGQYNNQTYAIPAWQSGTGEGRAIYINQELLEGVDYEKKDLYSYEDLDKVFAAVKEANPDISVLSYAGVLNNTTSKDFMSYDECDVTGGIAGVIMDPVSGNTEIENLYASDEYYEFLKWMHKWYEAGYISKDAATTNDLPLDWVRSGRAGFYMGYDGEAYNNNMQYVFGKDMVQFNIKEPFVSTSVYGTIRWGISSSSERPDKAMEFLNMLYDGEDAVNLVQNGIEGVHYIKHDDSMIISYPEGMDSSTTPYSNLLGLYGNKDDIYMFEPNEDSTFEANRKYAEEVTKKKSPALGYSFMSEDYTNEMAAVSSVISRYVTTLEYGMASDLDATYQEFLTELDNAGIQTLIEANKQQFAEWQEQQ